MKKKTIERTIRKKVSEWIESIEDDQLRRDLLSNVIVTGGAIASLLLREKVKDYDVYFRTKEIAKRVAKYYCKAFNESNANHTNRLGYKTTAFVLDGADVETWKAGSISLKEIAPGYDNQEGAVSHMITNTEPERIKIIVRSDGVAADQEHKEILDEPFEDAVEALTKADEVPRLVFEGDTRFVPLFLSPNAITLSGDVQLIIRFYGDPQSVHDNYDFVHCTNYWTEEEGVVLKAEAMESLLTKELVYVGSKYPVCSVIRTRKFLARGFTVNAGQYLKMLFQVSQLDLTDIAVLEDQLVGVDSAYFQLLIDALRTKMEKDKNFQINSGYLCSIIDKIF